MSCDSVVDARLQTPERVAERNPSIAPHRSVNNCRWIRVRSRTSQCRPFDCSNTMLIKERARPAATEFVAGYAEHCSAPQVRQSTEEPPYERRRRDILGWPSDRGDHSRGDIRAGRPAELACAVRRQRAGRTAGTLRGRSMEPAFSRLAGSANLGWAGGRVPAWWHRACSADGRGDLQLGSRFAELVARR